MGSTSSPFASMTTYRFWASCVSISTTRISSSSTSQVFLPVSSLFSILSLPNQIYQDNASLKNRKKQQGILYLLCCLYSKGIEISTRTTALQIHTRQWVGTYAGKGNGDYRGELASALRAITAYLKHFAFPPEMALVRLDGAYGDATVVAQLLLAGMAFVTRWRGYQLLERPQIRLVLAHPPTASVTRMNSGEIVDLFDGGWLEPCRDLPPVRVMVVRHAAPPPGKDIAVGKRVSGSTNSSSPHLTLTGSWSRMSWTSIMDVELSKWCWPMKMSKKIPTAGVPTRSMGKNCGKSRVNGCGTCASPWDRRCRESRCARSSGLLCWLLVASVGQNRLVRTPHAVSSSLPIHQRKSTISNMHQLIFTKGYRLLCTGFSPSLRG